VVTTMARPIRGLEAKKRAAKDKFVLGARRLGRQVTFTTLNAEATRDISGAMNAILTKGLRIPEDIALIGSGNLHFDDALRVPLSTVDQCSEMIGQRAALLAINLIEAKSAASPKTVFLTPKIVVRESTKRRNVERILSLPRKISEPQVSS